MREARTTQAKEENGGAWLRNAGPRHTSGVNTQSGGPAGRENRATGSVVVTSNVDLNGVRS